MSDFEPLRVIGTNLYDFSQAISALLVSNQLSSCVVLGDVEKVSGNSVLLIDNQPYTEFVFNPSSGQIAGSGTSGLLMLSALSRRSSISIGEYMTLSPAARSAYEPVKRYVTTKSMLLNCPNEWQKLRIKVFAFAVPLSYSSNGARFFDYGRTFDGNYDNFSKKYQVTPKGIVSVKVLSKKEAAELVVKTVENLHKSAEKGFSNAQYDLAVRYLSGDGVEKNRDQAVRWLEAAKTNRNSRAIQLLEELRRKVE